MSHSISKTFSRTAIALLAVSLLGGCVVAKTTGKVAALPFKGAYKTTELAGKAVYGTGKLTGQTVYGTGKLAGQTVYGTGKLVGKSALMTGKGVYYMGSVPVKITDKALDTTNKVLTITTQVVDLSGKVATTTRRIQSYELESELLALRGATNVLSVFVDAF
jgi:hypothetical protein